MQQMASVEYTENVTDDQLEAMAGGEAIRYQAAAFGVTRNNKVVNDCTCPGFQLLGINFLDCSAAAEDFFLRNLVIIKFIINYWRVLLAFGLCRR